MTSPLDLTTVANVHTWLKIPTGNTQDDALIQSCITAWGYEFLIRTGLGDQNTDFEQSPFASVCPFDETYDGNGGVRLFLQNRPIVSVSSLLLNGVQITESTSVTVQGFVIDGRAQSIALRQGTIGYGSQVTYSWIAGPFRALGGGLRFWRGIQNVNVQYSAGYATTPANIVQCANQMVAQTYKRRDWIDEESRSVAGGGGSVRFRAWAVPPECQAVIDWYTRTL